MRTAAAVLSRIPLQRGRADAGRGAAVPHLGPRGDAARHAAAREAGAAPPVRRRGDAAADRGAPVHLAVRGADHAAAHHGPAAERDPQLRHVVAARSWRAAGRRCRRKLVTSFMDSSATCSTTCTARPRCRGRASPTRPTCAPRRPRPAAARSAPGSASSTPRGKPVPPGVVGQIFVGNDMLFEGYVDGGSSTVYDNMMVDRRPRLPRRRRPPVRLRPRRRHDHLRRRERVPAPGRGAAADAAAGAGRGGGRRAGRGVRPALRRLRRGAAGRRACTPDAVREYVHAPPAPVRGAAGRDLRGRSCRATPRARWSAASWRQEWLVS